MKRENPEFKIRLHCCLALLLSLAHLSISPAAPPQIDPGGVFELPSNCIHSDFEAELEVMDTDGDYIYVSSNYGFVAIDSIYIDDFGISRWRGSIDFRVSEICGQTIQDDFIISAQDANKMAAIARSANTGRVIVDPPPPLARVWRTLATGGRVYAAGWYSSLPVGASLTAPAASA